MKQIEKNDTSTGDDGERSVLTKIQNEIGGIQKRIKENIQKGGNPVGEFNQEGFDNKESEYWRKRLKDNPVGERTQE